MHWRDFEETSADAEEAKMRNAALKGLMPVVLIGLSVPAFATSIPVPSGYGSIELAIQAANAGDDIYFDDDYSENGDLIIDKAVVIHNPNGYTVEIDGTGYSFGAKILSYAGDATIDGIKVLSGSNAAVIAESGTVSNCIIDGQDTAPEGSGLVVLGSSDHSTTASLTNSIFRNVSIDGYGIYVEYGGALTSDPAVISGNSLTMAVGGLTYGIVVEEGSNAEIENNNLEFTGSEADVGIYVVGGDVTISGNTVRNATQGMYLVTSSSPTSEISYNLLEDCHIGIGLVYGSVNHNTIVLTEAETCPNGTSVGIGCESASVDNNLIYNYDWSCPASCGNCLT
jgi:parallel beta-helix repeat protein